MHETQIVLQTEQPQKRCILCRLHPLSRHSPTPPVACRPHRMGQHWLWCFTLCFRCVKTTNNNIDVTIIIWKQHECTTQWNKSSEREWMEWIERKRSVYSLRFHNDNPDQTGVGDTVMVAAAAVCKLTKRERINLWVNERMAFGDTVSRRWSMPRFGGLSGLETLENARVYVCLCVARGDWARAHRWILLQLLFILSIHITH